MPTVERQPSMRKLRAVVRRQDVYWWVDRFLLACGVKPAESAARRSRRRAAARRSVALRGSAPAEAPGVARRT
jgi:hypothetical protein